MQNKPLLSVAEAKSKILETISVSKDLFIETINANGYVLASDIFSQIDLPPFHNSSMDGYAVRAVDIQHADSTNCVRLKVIEDIPAGYHPHKKIEKNQASRIMTGAELPVGADAVVPVEFTNYADKYALVELPTEIEIFKKVNPGDHVRPKGQDIQKGTKIFSKGHFLRPQDLGLISGVGIAKIAVYGKPRIALISSGDEIVPAGQPLAAGQIYDINSISIQTLLNSFGADVVNLGVAKDTRKSVDELLKKAVSMDIDLIISTAGVSVGVFDHIRDAIIENGNINFWRVNIRPGKPLVYGNYQSIPFFGVPGNPVSAFIISLIFLKPVISKMIGLTTSDPHYQQALLQESIESDGRESYLRGIVEKQGSTYTAKLTGHQGSGNIFSLVSANALLVIPPGVKSLPKGSQVNFIAL
ncbi:MAG: hypothetical protein CL609_20000 [Anaerolineaceae bacterium]|nr:hypothetical protein [Anaerolineaceae bacterium]